MPSYRRDIEGLRGLAVCLVVAFHVQSRILRGGFIGVDVFFVLSGYLITGRLVREAEETGRISIAAFYARRARRLLPASALMLLATLAVYFAFLPLIFQFRIGTSASATAEYLSNFWFVRHVPDYFTFDIRNNPFIHTWSLAVEEQFYLVWPAVIATGLIVWRSRQALLTLMMLIALSSFGLTLWLTGLHPAQAFYGSPARAWEFAIGGIALLCAPSCEGRGTIRAFAAWTGLLAIIGAAFLVRGEDTYPGWPALIPTIGTAALLNGATVGRVPARLLELPVLQVLGRLSYSWYLWHWPVLVVAEIEFPRLSFAGRCLCVLLSLGLAAITHVLVENPIRFSARLIPRPALSLALAGLVTAFAAGTSLAFEKVADRIAHSPQRERIVAGLEGFDQLPAPCRVRFPDTKPVLCASGKLSSPLTIVLLGDSHASQWAPAFEAVANARGWRLVMVSKPGCPTAQLSVYSVFRRRPFPECDVWRDAALKMVAEIHPAVVVMTNLSSYSVADPDGWRKATAKTLRFLNSAASTTVLLRDTPHPRVDVPECLAGMLESRWRIRAPAACDAQMVRLPDEEAFRAERAAATGLSHVFLLDLTDLLCDGDVCPAVRSGRVVYRDDSHINGQYARSIAPQLSERLQSLLEEPKPQNQL